MSKRDAFKDHVVKLVEVLRCKMLLQEWSYRVLFDQEFDTGHLACCVINDPYLEFTVQLLKELRDYFDSGRGWDLANTLAHELAHVHTEPLYLIACDATGRHSREHLENIRERQTSRIAHMIMLLLPQKLYKLKKVSE